MGNAYGLLQYTVITIDDDPSARQDCYQLLLKRLAHCFQYAADPKRWSSWIELLMELCIDPRTTSQYSILAVQRIREFINATILSRLPDSLEAVKIDWHLCFLQSVIYQVRRSSVNGRLVRLWMETVGVIAAQGGKEFFNRLLQLARRTFWSRTRTLLIILEAVMSEEGERPIFLLEDQVNRQDMLESLEILLRAMGILDSLSTERRVVEMSTSEIAISSNLYFGHNLSSVWQYICKIFHSTPLGGGSLYALDRKESHACQHLNLLSILANPGYWDQDERLSEMIEEHDGRLLLYYLRLGQPETFPCGKRRWVSVVFEVYLAWKVIYEAHQFDPCHDSATIRWPQPRNLINSEGSSSESSDPDSDPLILDECAIQAFLFFHFGIPMGQSLLKIDEMLGWPEHVDCANWMLDRYCWVNWKRPASVKVLPY